MLCTNPKTVQKAIEKKACNALLLKVNQVGSITESIEAVRISKVNIPGLTCEGFPQVNAWHDTHRLNMMDVHMVHVEHTQHAATPPLHDIMHIVLAHFVPSVGYSQHIASTYSKCHSDRFESGSVELTCA